MRVVGITGSLGTGKTTAACLFKKLGAKVLDADEISRRLTKSDGRCFNQIVRSFGKSILRNGEINRAKLANIVFQDKIKLNELNKIIHPKVVEEIREKIKEYKKQNTNSVIVLDVPLLIEAGLLTDVNHLVVVKASQKAQLSRITKRMNISKYNAVSRIKAQMDINDKVRFADFVIDNNGTLNRTQKQVKEIWAKITKKG